LIPAVFVLASTLPRPSEGLPRDSTGACHFFVGSSCRSPAHIRRCSRAHLCLQRVLSAAGPAYPRWGLPWGNDDLQFPARVFLGTTFRDTL
jgi:hypothetical protein